MGVLRRLRDCTLSDYGGGAKAFKTWHWWLCFTVLLFLCHCQHRRHHVAAEVVGTQGEDGVSFLCEA